MLSAAFITILCVSLAQASPAQRLDSRQTTATSVLPTSILAALNKTVEGRLAFGQPLALPCFSKFSGQAFFPKNDPAQCAVIQSRWSDSSLQSGSYGGYAESEWSGCVSDSQQCILDYTNPSNPDAYSGTCYQGSVSPVYIDVRKASDVVAAYAVAAATGIAINIKNTGHDYHGRSAAPNSLGLWTHNLKSITHVASGYKPAGCSETYSAMTVGAGAQFGAIFKYADDNGFTVVGGSSSSVGMSGGWLASGGHGVLANGYGLGVDNVIEFKVVLPVGGLVTASRCQNKDIFFALAGGGPNTVGVVMESTHITHPVTPMQVAFMGILTPTVDDAKKFIELSASRALDFQKRGWGGYLAITPRIGELSAVIMVNPKLSTAEATADVQPIIDWVATLPADKIVANGVFPVDTFYQAFTQFLVGPTGEAAPIGQPATVGSRLLTEELWAPSAVNGTVKALQDYMLALNPPAGEESYGQPVQYCLTSPFNTPATGFTAEPAAWRKTVIHALGGVAWSYDSTRNYKQGRKTALDTAVGILRKLKPNGQCYMNECFYDEPNYEKTYWDSAVYTKLVAIKKKYDPAALLNCWKCIGWKGASNPKYKCYT